MPLSSTVTEIWPFEVLSGRLFQEQRSVGSQYYTDLIYSSSLRLERSAREVKNYVVRNLIKNSDESINVLFQLCFL